jgi:hypothetical protein
MENKEDDLKPYIPDKNAYTKDDLDKVTKDSREEFEKLTDEECQRVTDAIAKHPEAGFTNKKEMHEFFEKAKRGELDK